MSIYNTIKGAAKNALVGAAAVTNPTLAGLYGGYKIGSGISSYLTGGNKPSSTPSPQMANTMSTMAKTQAPFGGFLSYYNTPISSAQKSGNGGGGGGSWGDNNTNSQYTPPTRFTSYYSNPTPTTNKPVDPGYTPPQENYTPPAPTDTQTNTSQNTNVSNGNDFDFQTMRQKLGLKDSPVYTPPDMSKYDAEYEAMRQEQNNRNAEIERNLNGELDAIGQRYNTERKKVADQTENERQSQLSNLYSVGIVNPASSGVSSIGTASQKVLDERNANVAAAEANEKAAARARAYGQKTEGFDKALQMLVSQRDEINNRAKEKYGMDRQVWQDAASEIGTVMDMWKAGKQLGQDEKDGMQKNISTLLTNFGSGAFTNVDPKELDKVEQIAGFPKGSLVGGIKTLKERELEAKKTGGSGLNLKEIDGSLYNIRTDQNGNLVPELVIQSTGGGNSKELNQLLSPSEAQTLGVPYGTTRGQAAQMGINVGGGGGGRPLTDTQAKLISEGNQLSSVLQPLYGIIDSKSDLFGPIAGRINGNNPYNTEAATISAQFKTAAQIIGGYLEGGKLTDSDIGRYQTMLPQLNDKPEVAKGKLDAIASLVQQKQQQYLQDFSRAGYNVSGFNGSGQKNNGSSSQNLQGAYQKLGVNIPYDQAVKMYGEDGLRKILQSNGISFNSDLSTSLKGSFEQKYPEGARGGQCASFARKLTYIPPLGDSLRDKEVHVDQIGMPANAWRNNPQVGDVVITNDNKENGHVFVVNTLLPNRMARVTESNWHGNERVTHDRIVPLDSPRIYGAIRAPLKMTLNA